MPEITSEENMMEVLGRYLPEGETILAAVSGVGLEVRLRQIIGKCVNTGTWFEPSENGKTYLVSVEKHCKFDLYIGVTQSHLLVSQCEPNNWFYQITESNVAAEGISERISHRDVGYCCYALSDIESCVVKKAWGGAVKCMITLKGGSYFKIRLPKLCEKIPDYESRRAMILKHLKG